MIVTWTVLQLSSYRTSYSFQHKNQVSNYIIITGLLFTTAVTLFIYKYLPLLCTQQYAHFNN
jgi:uncharacterized protein involved in response to NO